MNDATEIAIRDAIAMLEHYASGKRGNWDGSTEGQARSTIRDLRAALALDGGAAPVAQTPAPVFAKLATISADYDDARQALADAEDDEADDVAKAGMDAAAGAGFDLARAALAALESILPYAESRAEDLSDHKAAGDEDPEFPGAAEAWRAVETASALLSGQDATAAPQTPDASALMLAALKWLAQVATWDHDADADERAEFDAAMAQAEAAIRAAEGREG